MGVQVQCPGCDKGINVRQAHLGRTIRCPWCEKTFTPEATTAAAGASRTAPLEEVVPVEEGAARPAGDSRTALTGDDSREATRPVTPGGQPGHIGRFEVRARLGAGAFGTVYRAYDPQLDREVALKVPQAGATESRRAMERFLREARAAAGLRHPHIVPVYDAGRDGPHYYIASAFISGRTLSRAISEGKLGFRQAARIVRDLAEALAYAHGLGIVHRDVKSSNVMLDDKGQCHLMDFGLAYRQDLTEKLTHDGAVLGTPAYMAPEQAKGKSGDALPASDQYSLGVILYELLCGETPFSGPPEVVLFNAIHHEPPVPRSLRPKVPRELETICLKAMAKRPEARYADCQELADDLRRWLEGEPIKARRLGPLERVVRWCRREPKLAIATALVACSLVAVAVISLVSATRLAEAAEVEREKNEALATAKKNAEELKDQAEIALKKKIEAEKTTREAIELREKATQEKEAAAETARAKAAEAQREAEGRVNALKAKEAEETKNRHHLYDANFKLALREWDGARILGARQLLTNLDPALRDWEWRYLDRLMSRTSKLDLVHGSPVNAVAFSPNGKRLATATDDGKVRLWDAEKGGPALFTVSVAGAAGRGVAFSPDGALLASAWGDGKVRFHDPNNGKESFQPLKVADNKPATCLAFHPKQPWLVVGAADKVHRWSLGKNGLTPLPLPGNKHTREVSSVAFSPDGRFLVSASLGEGGDVKGWDFNLMGQLEKLKAAAPALYTLLVAKAGWQSGSYEPTAFPSGHYGGISSVAFHPKGTEGALGSPDHSVTVIRFKLTKYDLKDFGKLVGIADLAKQIGPIEVPEKAELFFMGSGHEGPVNGVVYCPGGEDRFASVSGDRTVKVWDRNRSVPLFAFKGHLDEVRAVAVNADGTRLASASRDGTAKVWDLTSRQESLLLPSADRVPVQAVAFSPGGGRYLAFGGGWPDRFGGRTAGKPDKGDLRVWDATTGKVVPLTGHKQGVTCVAFGLDGTTLRLASGSHDGKVLLWDVANPGKEPHTLQPEQGAVYAIAFSRDGKRLATAGQDGTVKVWDAAHIDKAPLLLRAGSEAVYALAFSPDGKVLAAGGVGGQVRLWDTATAKEARTALAHPGIVYSVAFSPDGKRLAVAVSDQTVKLWDVEAGKQVFDLKGHTGAVMGVAFSGNGKRLASASLDRTVKVWDVTTGLDVVTFPALATNAMGVAFSGDGARLAVADYAGSADVYDASPDGARK